LVVDEAATAVELDGQITVVNFQVQELRMMFAGRVFGKIEELSANSLPSMRGFDEEFVDPSAFAAIFQTEIEADDEIGDWGLLVVYKINEAEMCVAEKL